jgi:hypothetical protein
MPTITIINKDTKHQGCRPLAAGEQLTLHLPEIGASGYLWYVDSLPEGLGKGAFSLIGENDEREYLPSAGKDNNLVGGTATLVFKFQAQQPIDGAQLRLRCLRPWIGPGQEDQVLTITIGSRVADFDEEEAIIASAQPVRKPTGQPLL